MLFGQNQMWNEKGLYIKLVRPLYPYLTFPLIFKNTSKHFYPSIPPLKIAPNKNIVL